MQIPSAANMPRAGKKAQVVAATGIESVYPKNNHSVN
jgi:hypothetical protein